MIDDLHYLFNAWWRTVKRGKPKKRPFYLFLKLLGSIAGYGTSDKLTVMEIISQLLTGESITTNWTIPNHKRREKRLYVLNILIQKDLLSH